MGSIIKLKGVRSPAEQRFCETCDKFEVSGEFVGEPVTNWCWDFLVSLDPNGRCDGWLPKSRENSD